MSETNETIPKIVILTGDDTVGKEHFRNSYIDRINNTYPELIQKRYDSSSQSFITFMEEMITPSLFQEVRVFIITHAHTLSDSELTLLNKNLDYDIPDVFLVIEGQSGAKKGTSASEGKITKKLQLKKRGRVSHIEIQDFSCPPEYKTAEWLVSNVPSLFSRRIAKEDAEYLVDLVGSGLDLLYSELQKININLAPKAPIERDVIDKVVGATRPMTPFELAGALGEKKLPRALEIVDTLFSCGFSAPFVISAIYRHFWALLRIRKFLEANPALAKIVLSSSSNYQQRNEAAFEVGVASGLLSKNDKRRVYPVIIKSNIIYHAKRFKNRELREIIRWLREFDVGVKTGRVDPNQYEIQMLCYRIVRVEQVLELAGT
ncbi:hypothetical protein QA601_04765 [Chitinispirillales bacterium ANBcel5]|uniref:DNA polymerase III subunit delta n=1 Tax=Cellulosispirillum alkaliphilum TaxID=3039283 RepID=UPI002A593CB6|nr:hypothetical protein [Chitinispirillales bacterium ANBcel5]